MSRDWPNDNVLGHKGGAAHSIADYFYTSVDGVNLQAYLFLRTLKITKNKNLTTVSPSEGTRLLPTVKVVTFLITCSGSLTEKLMVLSWSRNSLPFMECVSSLLPSRESAIGPYPEPAESSPHPYVIHHTYFKPRFIVASQ